MSDYGVVMTSLPMIELAILFLFFFSLLTSLVVLCLFSGVLAIAKLIVALLFGSNLSRLPSFSRPDHSLMMYHSIFGSPTTTFSSVNLLTQTPEQQVLDCFFTLSNNEIILKGLSAFVSFQSIFCRQFDYACALLS